MRHTLQPIARSRSGYIANKRTPIATLAMASVAVNKMTNVQSNWDIGQPAGSSTIRLGRACAGQLMWIKSVECF